MTSLKRRTSLLWTVHPAPSKVILSLSSPFFSFLFCFLVLPHSVNKYLLSTCQVPGLAGKRNKTRKKTDEPLPSRSWHSVRACGTDRWALWEGNQGVLWSARGDSLPRFRNLGEGTSTMRPEDKGGLAIQRMGRSVQKEQHVQRQEMEWGRGGFPGPDCAGARKATVRAVGSHVRISAGSVCQFPALQETSCSQLPEFPVKSWCWSPRFRRLQTSV